MSRAVIVAAFCVAWGVPCVAAAQLAALAAAATTPSSPGPRCELEWIARDIVRVIAQGAVAPRRGPTGGPRLDVRLRAADPAELLNVATLDIRADGRLLGAVAITRPDWHVWTPDAYVDVARALVAANAPVAAKTKATTRSRKPAQATAPPDLSVITRLLDPRIDVLLAEEARVSAAMVAAPADPGPLENAALLVAMLAFRETAGAYDDVRPLLSRATGLLALARAMGKGIEPGQAGRLATTVINIMAGRDDLALSVLGSWPKADDHSIAASWTRALLLRITGDWRQLADSPSTTRLERLEYARALRESLGSARLLDFLDTQPDQQSTDWSRIALNVSGDASVEAGHRFVDTGLEGELSVMSRVWLYAGRGDAPIETVIAALNDLAPAEHRAIDWPTWAGVLQRHLCAVLHASARRLATLGLDDDQLAWIDEMRSDYGALRFFPLLAQAAASNEAQYRAATPQARALQASHPELITPRQSAMLRQVPAFVAKGDAFPSDVAWFTPHVPSGTAYDIAHRSLAPGGRRGVPLEQVTGWAARRPYDMWVAWASAWQPAAGVPAYDDVERALARVLPYDLEALDHMRRYLEPTPTQALALSAKLCELSVDQCDRLGDELVGAGREDEAATVLDRYATAARDAVGVSNSVGWLVHHYWDTGRRERAVELAERAGATYSAAGLAVLGEVRERQGRLPEAREIFERITERYGRNNTALASHLLREARRTRKAALIAQVAAAVPDAFPHGIEGADPFGLPAPPFDGIVFQTFGPRAARTGLRATDIIVGIDGYRVRSVWQFQVLVRGAFEGPVAVIVWRDKRYQRIDVPLPQRWFGAAFDTFPSARQVRVSD